MNDIAVNIESTESDLVDQAVIDQGQAISFATVRGQPFSEMPHDLYIPPEAMEVFLEAFSGPFDLLLYLIKRDNIDILDIPVFEITKQYMAYVELMKTLHLELAAEYLVMAATLAEIKSRMLLPRPESLSEENDPRADLARRLQEYERFKAAAENIDMLPRLERDNFLAHAEPPILSVEKALPDVMLKELLLAFKDVLHRANLQTSHMIDREPLSIRERMTTILSLLGDKEFTPFLNFFTVKEGRSGLVVTFIATLELIREGLIELVQGEPFAPIYIRLTRPLADEKRHGEINYEH
jgi:segregation and condensation protein A